MVEGRTVGFVGLGVMGSAMAATLARAGVTVIGFDVSESAKELATDQVRVVDSLAEVVQQCSTIFLSLPGPPVSRAVFSEILAAASGPVTVIDTSTIDPETAAEHERLAGQKGHAYVAAPVAGGESAAKAGSLTVIAGGTGPSVDAIEPMLHLIGADIHVVESARTASLLKLLNNLMTLGNTIVFTEALALAASADVPASTVYDVLKNSSGGSAIFTRRWKANIEPGNYSPGFSVNLAVKDLGLALDFARSQGVTLAAADHARTSYTELQELGWGDRDVASIVESWETRLKKKIGGQKQ